MKDNTEHAWWIPSDPYEDRFKKQQEARQEESQKEQFSVNYCTSCKKAYQYSWDGRDSRFFYFEDFPTYGLQRKRCGKCTKS